MNTLLSHMRDCRGDQSQEETSIFSLHTKLDPDRDYVMFVWAPEAVITVIQRVEKIECEEVMCRFRRY
jgi:hypothetical protein